MIADFFTAKENTAFVVALVVLAVLSLLIVTATLLGAIHLPEADADLEVDWDSDGLMNGLLEFFGISAMPSVHVSMSIMFAFLPGWVAIAPAMFVTLGCCRLVGKAFAKTKFKLHTTAVASSSFLFRLVTIQSGVAKAGLSAEAKLVDDHGQTHYVLVEPKNPEEVFPQGSQVILVEQAGSRFLAVSGNVEDILNNDK